MPDENVREMWSDDQLDTALADFRSDVDTDDRALARARTNLLVAAGPHPPATAPGRRGTRDRRARGASDDRSAERGPAGDQPAIVDTAASVQLNAAADRIRAADESLAPGQFR